MPVMHCAECVTCCTWRRVFTTSKGVVMKAAAVPEIELAIKATNGD